MLDNVCLRQLLIFFLLLAFSLLTLNLILKANKKNHTPTNITEYVSIENYFRDQSHSPYYRLGKPKPRGEREWYTRAIAQIQLCLML